jgi:hypothetical protein
MGRDDDYSTDDSEKKRKAIKEVAESFERSKKTPRSPQKTQKKEEDKLDLILNIIREMKKDQIEIKNETHQIRAEQKGFNEEIKKLKQNFEILRKENDEIKKENKEMKEKLQDTKKTLEWIEKERRKNNVVMSGMFMNTNDPAMLKDGIENFLKEHVKTDTKAKAVTKIAEKTYVIELENENDKKKVMQNKSKLKDYKAERVYINDDLTKEERDKQRQIRLMAQEEKGKGRAVKTGYNKVTIDGIEWKWNTDAKKLEKTGTKN